MRLNCSGARAPAPTSCSAQPHQPLGLAVGPRNGAEPPPLLLPFGAALLMSGCRGPHQLPDKEVQEAKGKSGSPNVSGDILCYIAHVTLAKFVAMAELQPCMH